MLDFMRRNARGWAVRIALGIIALVFIFFMGGGGQIGGGATAIATVGDTSISAMEFEQSWRRNESFYREQYGERVTPELLRALDLPSMTLNQLIDAAVIRGEAERLGLRVPDEAVRSEIREIPAFQLNGQFSPNSYRRALESRGMSPAGFESGLRRDLLVEQLVDLIRRGVHVSDEEAFQDWAKQNEKMTLSYVRVPSEKVASEVTVDDEALTKYYTDHAESYRKPEAVRARYVAYSPAHFGADAEIGEEQINEYYVLNESEFEQEETVSARHVLKQVAADADDAAKAEAKAAIEKVKARLDAGEDFAKVAEEESEDAGSAKSGGDLGSFGRGRMVKPFEDAAFGLQPGETSGVVESQFGYHIIRVYDRKAAGKQPLEQVHDQIIEKLREKAGKDRAFELSAADALEIREGRSDLDKIAESRKLEVKTTDFVSKGDVVAEVGADPAFVDAALQLAKLGNTSDPVRVGETYYLIALEERRESSVPEMAEVREKVEADYRKEKSLELASAKADAMITALTSGKTLEDAAAAEGLTVETTEAFGRAGAFIPGLGNVKGLKDVAFQAKADGEALPRSFKDDTGALVLVRKSFEAADRTAFDETKQDVLDNVRRSKEQAAVEEFVRSLKENTTIALNEQLLDRYQQ